MPRHTRADDLAPHQNGARRRAAAEARNLQRLRKLDIADGGSRVSRAGDDAATTSTSPRAYPRDGFQNLGNGARKRSIGGQP
jgi:hypothetical protein